MNLHSCAVRPMGIKVLIIIFISFVVHCNPLYRQAIITGQSSVLRRRLQHTTNTCYASGCTHVPRAGQQRHLATRSPRLSLRSPIQAPLVLGTPVSVVGGWCSKCVSLVTLWQCSSRPPLSRLTSATTTPPRRPRTYLPPPSIHRESKAHRRRASPRNTVTETPCTCARVRFDNNWMF